MSIDSPAARDASMDGSDIPASPASSVDSLFDDSEVEPEVEVLAVRSAPPIPGLYVFPGILPRDLACELGGFYALTFSEHSGCHL